MSNSDTEPSATSKEPISNDIKTKEELLKEKLEELRKNDPFIY